MSVGNGIERTWVDRDRLGQASSVTSSLPLRDAHTTLEGQSKLQLHLASTPARSNFAKLSRIDVLRKNGEGWVIEHVQRFHAELTLDSLNQWNLFDQRGIHAEQVGAGEAALLQRTDISRGGIGKGLSQELG